ncbi:MAG: hypothetical protein HY692_07330, partial [Cyanobacteria bacterium NC_groundwater_1444_Ag_S-0.65um_54_12]|nr:hypothetical protein [Cyanobacteria bacterium NC_groundwater_1444_Ag_S-0.65um_54_12]
VIPASSDLKGMIFPANGYLAFDWESLPTTDKMDAAPLSFTPPASERFVYLYETGTNGAEIDLAKIKLLLTVYPRGSVTGGGVNLDKTAWRIRRVPLLEVASEGSFQEPNMSLPVEDRDATYSLESSFSAVVDPAGRFTLEAASGEAAPCLFGELCWQGPVATHFYYVTTQPIEWNRVSLKFPATASMVR